MVFLFTAKPAGFLARLLLPAGFFCLPAAQLLLVLQLPMDKFQLRQYRCQHDKCLLPLLLRQSGGFLCLLLTQAFFRLLLFPQRIVRQYCMMAQ